MSAAQSARVSTSCVSAGDAAARRSRRSACTLEFDEHDEPDRQRIARLYRHASVRPVMRRPKAASSIEADVPRRLLGRLAADAAR